VQKCFAIERVAERSGCLTALPTRRKDRKEVKKLAKPICIAYISIERGATGLGLVDFHLAMASTLSD